MTILTLTITPQLHHKTTTKQLHATTKQPQLHHKTTLILPHSHHHKPAPRPRNVNPSDYPHLETIVSKVVKEKQPFERLVVKKEDLLQMFKVVGVVGVAVVDVVWLW